MMEVGISPAGRSPDVRPARVEGVELQLEHNTRSQTGIGGWNHALLLVCSTSHAGALWHFAATAIASGSIAFIFIYLLLLSLVGVSFAMLELSLGQYTSLPVSVIFGRIAPITTGVGILLIVVRLFNSLFINLRSNYIIFFYKYMMMTLTSDTSWLDCSSYLKWPCISEICRQEEIWMNNKCISENATVFTTLPAELMVDIYTRSDSSVNFSPSHIFLLELAQKTDLAQLIGGVCVLALAGVIAYYGNKFFAKIAPLLVISTIIGICIISAHCLYQVIQLENFYAVAVVLKPKWYKLGELETWLNCALQVLFTVGLGDGTLITLGSYADFRNDLIKEVTIMTIVGAGLRLIVTMAAIFLACASNQAKGIGLGVLIEMGNDAHSFWYRLPFTLLPELGKDSMAHRLCCDVFYLAMVISLIGLQVVTIEIFLSAIYRTFSQLMHLPEKITRYTLVSFVVAAMCLILGVNHFFNQSLTDDYFYRVYFLEIFTVLVFYQLLTILAIYGARRVIVNMETMIGQHYSRQRIALGGKITWLTWILLLPIFALTLLLASGVHKKYYYLSLPGIVVSFLAAIPLMVAAHLITKSVCEGGQVYRLFKTHHKWGPLNIQNRRIAERDEMAARVYFY